MKTQLLILSAILTSCGSESGSNAPASTDTVKEESKDYKTYYLASRSDLMACEESSTGYLVYLKDEQVFLACDGFEWSEVTIKTETKVVEKQVNEIEVEVDSPNIFKDTLTGLEWHLVGSATKHPYECNGTSCVSTCEKMGMRLPLRGEFPLALSHGMWAQFSKVADGLYEKFFVSREDEAGTGDLRYQVNAATGGSAIGYYYMNHNGQAVSLPSTNSAIGIYCIAD